MTEKSEAWPLTLLKVSWIVLGALLHIVTVVLIAVAPGRVALWTQAMAPLLILDGAMGAAAWSGPNIRRAQEAKE